MVKICIYALPGKGDVPYFKMAVDLASGDIVPKQRQDKEPTA